MHDKLVNLKKGCSQSVLIGKKGQIKIPGGGAVYSQAPFCQFLLEEEGEEEFSESTPPSKLNLFEKKIYPRNIFLEFL